MGVTPTVPMGPLANVSTSNLAYNIIKYLCINFGAFVKKCTIDQLIRSTMSHYMRKILKRFTVGNDPDIGKKWILLKICTIVGNCLIKALQKTASKNIEYLKSYV